MKIWRSTFQPGHRLGNVVIEADHVSKGYDKNLLVDDMNFACRREELWCDWAKRRGKTTFRMITEQEQP